MDNVCGADPALALRAEPVPRLGAARFDQGERKRNWRGQFVKRLRATPEGSREWLIWSHYHGAWHRRSDVGGACGYTADISHAGLFCRETADLYNDGDRNEAYHASEKLAQIEAALERHLRAASWLFFARDIALGAVAAPKEAA